MREIPLTRGLVAIVDDDDYDLVSSRSWHAVRSPGARECWYGVHIKVVNKVRIRTRIHRLILGAPAEYFVDHINGDGLDNRRSNLRLATHRQNVINSRRQKPTLSGFRGVTVSESSARPYRAKINIAGRLTHLGVFPTAIEAARAYDEAARQYHGEFARLNFPDGSTLPGTDAVRDVHVALGAGA